MFGRGLRRSKKDVYNSLVFGRGLYTWDGDVIQDPFPPNDQECRMSPLLQNQFSGERFFAKRFDGTDPSSIRRYHKCILNPMPPKTALWPRDMIVLEEGQQDPFDLWLQNEYTDVPTAKQKRGGQHALLFPCESYEHLESGEDHLAHINREYGWKSPEVRKMAIQIARAILRINNAGYLYADLHLSRMFFGGDSCYLIFSNLVYPIEDLEMSQTASDRAPKRGEYPLEFAEPAYVQGKVDAMDMRTQNFGLAALLFYLLFGRYAYDGNMTEHLVDDDPISHYNKLEFFLETPIFVFDPHNHDNALGDNLMRNRATLALWDDLPPDLQHFFVRALSTDAAERRTEAIPSPRAWVHRFWQDGWNEYDERGFTR